jgi:hypothetical protein
MNRNYPDEHVICAGPPSGIMNNAVDRDAIVCAAIDVSTADGAAMVLLNRLLFYLGMSSDRHLEQMLGNLSEWEQAIGDCNVGPKQAFRWLIEEKANSWAARRRSL